MHATVLLWRSENNLQGAVLTSHLWLELRSPGLASGVFTRWVILLALWCHFYHLIHFKFILMYSMNRILKLFPKWIRDNCCNKCLSPNSSVHTHVQWCELTSLYELSISMYVEVPWWGGLSTLFLWFSFLVNILLFIKDVGCILIFSKIE